MFSLFRLAVYVHAQTVNIKTSHNKLLQINFPFNRLCLCLCLCACRPACLAFHLSIRSGLIVDISLAHNKWRGFDFFFTTYLHFLPIYCVVDILCCSKWDYRLMLSWKIVENFQFSSNVITNVLLKTLNSAFEGLFFVEWN